MLYHAASLNTLSTIVLTLYFKLKTIIHNMLIHTGQRNHLSTLKNTFHNPIRALMELMLLYIHLHHFSTNVRDRTWDEREIALIDVLFYISYFLDLFAAFIWTGNGKLVNESSNRNVGSELANNCNVTKWALGCLNDATFAEEIVAAWRLHRIHIYIQAYGTQPSIIWETARGKVRKVNIPISPLALSGIWSCILWWFILWSALYFINFNDWATIFVTVLNLHVFVPVLMVPILAVDVLIARWVVLIWLFYLVSFAVVFWTHDEAHLTLFLVILALLEDYWAMFAVYVLTNVGLVWFKLNLNVLFDFFLHRDSAILIV